MSYRNPNTSQGSDDFNNLKDSLNSEADFSGELGEEKKARKENKFEKKFLFKKESKDKGYSSLTGDTNQDSVFLVNTKNSKKPKADTKITSLSVFKKSFKDEKRLKDIKETKEEVKRNKKLKERNLHVREHKENLFGNHLENAVRFFPSNDGVKVPAPIRICLDLIEQNGIDSEHLYRRSVNKSQLEGICDAINSGKIETKLDELTADPNLACSIVKKFLRELKTPLVSDELVAIFEKCDSSISDKDTVTKVEILKKQIFARMPQPNLDTFTYLTNHFYRILYKSDLNKLEISMFVQKFQPIFRLREKLFKFIISHADLLFSEYRFKKYKIKADDTVSRFSMLPDSIEELEQEISKQEVYLSKLHSKIANEENSSDKTVQEQLSEELWALQRYVTSLKRKVKKLKLERKSLETEQMNKVKETKEGAKTAADGTAVEEEQPVDPNSLLSPSELYNKDMGLLCENMILMETIQQLLDKTNQERIKINEYQQMLNSNLTTEATEAINLSPQELIEKEQLVINENKLLEERINLINKRINNEKEKIFELKLSIQLQTVPNMTNDQLMSLGSKQLQMTEKELVMTKL